MDEAPKQTGRKSPLNVENLGGGIRRGGRWIRGRTGVRCGSHSFGNKEGLAQGKVGVGMKR